ncbi:MAG: 16S rRNA (adenine(1518)-N(6)/adenine(1519)-N(6))-dimethyltransferase RsmA [Alphaproteobacteria bacterium]
MSGSPDLPPLREVIRELGLSARRGLGQHFLLDLNLTRRIARAAGPLEGHAVYEVGPGPGGLTRALLAEGAAHVIAVERDRRCLAAIEDIAAAFPGRVSVIEADALHTDEDAVITGAAPGLPVKIAANLPYNVGTELLVRWLTAEPWPPWYESLTVMLQKEVAERAAAPAGSGVYGRLSVLAQWRAQAQVLFDVSPRAFTPPPKVTSSVLQITPRPAPEDGPGLSALERVTAAAFGQRRKMLRAALRRLTDHPEELLEAAGIAPTARAEEVDIEGFCRLARAWAERAAPPGD